MIAETTLSPHDLVWPVFIRSHDVDAAIPGFFDVKRYVVDELYDVCKKAIGLGIPSLGLFPYTPPHVRSDDGDEAYNPDNLLCQAIRAIKKDFPKLGLIADIALDPFTSHGHDGVIRHGMIHNDETIKKLIQQALNYARAGVDVVAPSDMMDGRIGEIRKALDNHGYETVLILSYAVKYASSFYGPFRSAVGAPTLPKGLDNKLSYQMDPRNSNEALKEAALDIQEGADMLMVKPGLPYLDILRRVKDTFSVPVGAYQISGEYAMIKAAAQQGFLDEEKAFMESITCLKRAGADFIFTYAADRIAEKI
jgi:porphobilinogen synthase